MRNILIVDDEKDIRMLIKGILTDEGYDVSEAYNIESALIKVEEKKPSLILLDMWLDNDNDGMKLLNIFKTKYSDIPVIIISGHGNVETAVNAIKNGAYDFIEKPFKASHLLIVINRALETFILRRENFELKQSQVATSDIHLIGKSFYVNNLKQLIVKVASTNSRVLITGPAGSGKEIIARNIHKKSERKDKPFITLDSSNLTFENFEEKIFGSKDNLGIIEKANQGTVLIDEIADLSLKTQGMLVKFIQDSFSNIRIIATSNKNLKEEISNGNLREDLYYRLNVVPIETIPLKERREDIDVLCPYFMKSFAGKDLEFTTEAILALRSYSWPGNIRQLKNTMEWIAIMHADEISNGKIDINILPNEITNRKGDIQNPFDICSIISLPLKDAKDVFEKEYLTAQIARFEKNISQTAKFIGMERTALHRKLKQLGVNLEK